MLKDLCTLPSDLYRNRRLVKKMAKNDLKSRFAGSFFETIWAFIQPIVTILVYYFVFGIAMCGRAASGDGTPSSFTWCPVLFHGCIWEGLDHGNQLVSGIQLSGKK